MGFASSFLHPQVARRLFWRPSRCWLHTRWSTIYLVSCIGSAAHQLELAACRCYLCMLTKMTPILSHTSWLTCVHIAGTHRLCRLYKRWQSEQGCPGTPGILWALEDTQNCGGTPTHSHEAACGVMPSPSLGNSICVLRLVEFRGRGRWRVRDVSSLGRDKHDGVCRS